MNDDKKLEVIWVQPMREPQLIEIDNDLESMQELVDGYIEEYMPFEDDAAIVCNEEGWDLPQIVRSTIRTGICRK